MSIDVKCPNCSKLLTLDDDQLSTIFCIKCGTKINLSSYLAPTCSKCGKKGVERDQMFCLYCGNNMKEPVLNNSSISEPSIPSGAYCPKCHAYMKFKDGKLFVFCNNCGTKIDKP